MDLLSRSECEQIVANKCKYDLTLEHYEVQSANDVIGFLGEYYRLVLNCSELTLKAQQQTDSGDKIVLNFFIKAINHAISENEKLLIFRKEANLYASLLKKLQNYTTTVLCPKSYYSRSDLLVLEDLNALGYEKCRTAGQNLKEAELKAILRVLAAMHAASITHEFRTGLELDKQYPAEIFQEITVAPHIAWFTTGLKAILTLAKNHPTYQNPEMQSFIKNELKTLLERVYEMQKPSRKYLNVLCHRDPWHANVLFDYNKMCAVLVDFQTCCYCPPCVDVIFALFMNLDSDVRKSNEKMFLCHYYEQLRNELAVNSLKVEQYLTESDFFNSYEEFKLFGYLYRAIAMTLLSVPAEFLTNEYRFVERGAKLLEYMKMNTKFCISMQNCVGELLDFVIKNVELNNNNK